MPRSRRALEIHKFGGASLANGAAIAHAVSVIRAQRPAPLVVVVSAMAGVTDALLDLAGAAVRGDADGARATLDRLVAQHRAAVAALVRAAPRADELLQAMEGAFPEVEPLAAGLRVLRALTPREVSLWKDVPGVLTADPRIVPDARVIPQLHVREAAELAYYGAKVLHPRALVPVLRRNVAVRIRPFAEPASLGTEISRRC